MGEAAGVALREGEGADATTSWGADSETYPVDIEHGIDDRMRRTIQANWQVRGSVAAASGLRETRLREGVATSKS